MEERNLGKSGLRVSLVGLGANNFGVKGNNHGVAFDLETTKAVIYKALDLGVTLIDTADAYGKRGGSEEAIGLVLGDHRKNIVLATKFGQPMDDAGHLRGASRRYMVAAVEASLKRLKTDWIDLYQLHGVDPATPIEETIGAFDQLIRAGKIRYAGISNFPAWRTVEAAWVARDLGAAALVSAQEEYNLLARGIETDIVPVLERYGLGLLPYYPLASGFLSGKYKRDVPAPEGTRLALSQRSASRQMTQPKWEAVEKLGALCERSGRTLLDLAWGWLASKKFVGSIIAGATSPAQVEQNVKAAECALTPAELAEIDEITAGFR